MGTYKGRTEKIMKNNTKVKKVVLAYSGGLDTSVMVRWLKDNYNCEVVACCVDVGQGKIEIDDVKAKAVKSGASKCFVIDARKEFAEEYIWPALKAQAIYERKYLLATALARPVIAEKVIETARRERADSVAHGATGKGNDQVRFELTFMAMEPGIKIIAPWREWHLYGREDEIEYAKKHGIPVPVTKAKPYSSDANLWHISYEGGILEDLENEPKEDMFQWTVSPQRAPEKPETIEISFEQGIPVALNNKKTEAVKLIEELNQSGGRNGIGRVDIVENRLVGIKSRGVYECPAATILYAAHRELEAITLDRETLHAKELVGPKYGELIYYGLWFTSLRRSLAAFVDATQENVSGIIQLELYKGNITIKSRKSSKSLYSRDIATFEKDSFYNQKDAEGFINLFGLPLRVEALLSKQKTTKQERKVAK